MRTKTYEPNGRLNTQNSTLDICFTIIYQMKNIFLQFSIVYFEPDGDHHYKFNSKPKLVTVPDTEIMQVNCKVISFRFAKTMIVDVLWRLFEKHSLTRVT